MRILCAVLFFVEILCVRKGGWLAGCLCCCVEQRTVNNKQVSVPFANCSSCVCVCVQMHSIELCTFRISYFVSIWFIYFSPGAANICCLLLAFHFGLLLLFSDCRFSLSHTFAFRQQMNVKTGGIKKTRVSSVLPTNSFHITWIKPYHWHRIFIHQTWISNYFLPTIADSFRDSMIYIYGFYSFICVFLSFRLLC